MNSPVTGFIFSVLFPHQGWWYEDFRKSNCRSKKATAGHLVTYHTDSLYYLASRCRAFGCLDAGCVLLAVYEFSELPRSTRWWAQCNAITDKFHISDTRCCDGHTLRLPCTGMSQCVCGLKPSAGWNKCLSCGVTSRFPPSDSSQYPTDRQSDKGLVAST